METRSLTDNKVSASALAAFCKSPRGFFYSYKMKLTGPPSVQSYDHDKLFGIHWSEFVDRFYKEVPERENIEKTKDNISDAFAGWVPSKTGDQYMGFVDALGADYYRQFRPDDGVRTPEKSELFVSDDLFFGYLDGQSNDGVIHEVKSTSRAPQLSEQIWTFHNSIQIKLYAVLTDATGVRMEFAWKDKPNVNFRNEVMPITADQRILWRQQLRALAERILSLGDDINNYPCHASGCNLITKRFVGTCQFQALCSEIPGALELYQTRKEIR